MCTNIKLCLFCLVISTANLFFKVYLIYGSVCILGFREHQGYDIQCTKQTIIEVTQLQFTAKPPRGELPLTIADVKNLSPRQLVGTLEAAVCSMDDSPTMVNIRQSQCEVLNCCIGDRTSRIQLSLWDNQMSMVKEGQSYTFTNLSTRNFMGQLVLTSTRQTKIQSLDRTLEVAVEQGTCDSQKSLKQLNSNVVGAQITVKKQCPTCHTAQHIDNSKEVYHRCQTCKMLRQTKSYTTKCSGLLLFETCEGEITMNISHSIISKFIQPAGCIDAMDSQDIEESFLGAGILAVTYTHDNNIADIQQMVSEHHTLPKEQGDSQTLVTDTSTEEHDNDEELAACAVSAYESVLKSEDKLPLIVQQPLDNVISEMDKATPECQGPKTGDLHTIPTVTRSKQKSCNKK
ncbi:hypothetical protein AMEX_G10668 [Astyanax mexicanus]|uniref:Uncharacterized protein n=1 Tax=Astyanax mexicanus TaxID=7994 RepID=A0A8T2LWG4_ASTMX|nr:hypothetical protein AMEX_G10668 [Astyanax mexicanus]